MEVKIQSIPEVHQLMIILTEKCNSCCQHCTFWKNKRASSIDKELFKEVLQKFAKNNLKSVMLTGGEPLLHSDFEFFVRYLYDSKIAIKVTSNGICIKNIPEETLKKISEFTISLDSANSETYLLARGVDKFDCVIENIKYLSKLGIKVKLSFSIRHNNFKQLPIFLDICNNVSIKEVAFIVMNKNGDFNNHQPSEYSSLFLNLEDIKDLNKEVLPLLKIKLIKYNIKSNYKIDKLHIISDYYTNLPIRNFKCSFPLKNLVLSPRGKIKLCPFTKLFLDYRINNKKLLKERSKFLSDPKICEKYCKYCLEVPL